MNRREFFAGVAALAMGGAKAHPIAQDPRIWFEPVYLINDDFARPRVFQVSFQRGIQTPMVRLEADRRP